jgi:hypothetical protein
MKMDAKSAVVTKVAQTKTEQTKELLSKEQLQKYIDQGFSIRKIAEATDRSMTTVTEALKKFGLKTKGKTTDRMNIGTRDLLNVMKKIEGGYDSEEKLTQNGEDKAKTKAVVRKLMKDGMIKKETKLIVC